MPAGRARSQFLDLRQKIITQADRRHHVTEAYRVRISVSRVGRLKYGPALDGFGDLRLIWVPI